MIPLVCWAKRLKYEENCLLYYFSPIPPSTSTAEYNYISNVDETKNETLHSNSDDATGFLEKIILFLIW